MTHTSTLRTQGGGKSTPNVKQMEENTHQKLVKQKTEKQQQKLINFFFF